MASTIISAVITALTQAGFTAAQITTSPKCYLIKDKYIAFVTLTKAQCRQTGFDFDTGARKRINEYTVEARLMGKQGDCSDRDTLLEMAEAARASLISQDTEATLSHTMKIDPVLSRAECLLKVTKSITETPTGGV